jgi:hypothetical protein
MPLVNMTIPTPTSMSEKPISSVFMSFLGNKVGKSAARMATQVIVIIIALISRVFLNRTYILLAF